MKKTLLAAVTAAMFAAPALAGSITMSFAQSDGTVTVMTFDDDGTASVEGVDGTFPYTWDDDAHTLCGDYTGTGEVCATFNDNGEEPSVGQVAAYTTSDGREGEATITAMAE